MITAGAGAVAAGNAGLDLSSIAGSVVGGGVGGAVLTLIAGIVRKMFVGHKP
jgi:fucose permease